jgi:peptidoglycan hydrolase-like protein with peptidoglycan-binding domain
MNNASGHIAILAGAGMAAYALSALVYPGQRTETASSAQEPVVVTLPQRASEPAAPRAVPTPRDPISLTRQLQSELRRVGCYGGEISGVWTTRTRMAMKAFTDRVNATLPIDKPDHILLALVQGHQGTACGTSCPTGQVLGDDGRCLPGPILAKAAKKPEPPEAAAAEKPPPAIAPPIVAVAPKLPPQPSGVTSATPKPEPSSRAPTIRSDPAPGLPQAREPGTPIPPGERPRHTLRYGGPVPPVGIYERRLRRSLRPSRQVRYARSLLRSLQRAAMAPWRLP